MLAVGALVAIAVVSRLLPHPPNFTPLAALALFAGATSRRPWAAGLIVLAAMAISDAVIGMHSLMPVVYGCLLVNVTLGHTLVRRQTGSLRRVAAIGGTSLVGSVLFFLITNLACWVAFYPPTMAGVTTCFVAAIPFFQNTIAGDLAFATIIFGGMALVPTLAAAVDRFGGMSLRHRELCPVPAVAPTR